jgi:hypothetical protein
MLPRTQGGLWTINAVKIKLTMHGGYAAGIRRVPVVVDLDQLDPTARSKIEKLVAEAAAAPHADAESIRDGITYVIEVSGDGQTQSLSQTDGAMSDSFAALLGLIQEKR